MSLLRSKATRVFYSDNGALVDKTEETRTWGTPNFAFTWEAANDALYIGRSHKFNNLYIAMTTANALDTVMTVAYWNPNKKLWVNFTELLDETNGFKQSGFIQWEEPADVPLTPEVWNWGSALTDTITGLGATNSKQKLYWVKITLSADTSATSVRAIKCLFSDDRMMTVIHPEIMNYLPSGQSDFLPQHELAKDEIVDGLIIDGLIEYEEQIKNPDDFHMAAAHRCVEIILRPIAGDERLKEIKDLMSQKATQLCKRSAASLDSDKDEVLTLKEVEPKVNRYGTR